MRRCKWTSGNNRRIPSFLPPSHTWNQVTESDSGHCDETEIVAVEESPTVLEQEEETCATGEIKGEE